MATAKKNAWIIMQLTLLLLLFQHSSCLQQRTASNPLHLP
jgi:hypothetical protein